MKSLMIAAFVAASLPAAAIAQDAAGAPEAPAAAEAAQPQAEQAAAPANATELAELLKPGRTIRDAGNLRLGKIDRVTDDGSVRLIFNSRFVTIPASTLSANEGNLVTSLTKREVSRLR